MLPNFTPLPDGLEEHALLRVLASLSQGLTVAVRISWSEPKLSPQAVVAELKELNEVQHRVTARIGNILDGKDEWTEKDFTSLFQRLIQSCPRLQDVVLHLWTQARAEYKTGQEYSNIHIDGNE